MTTLNKYTQLMSIMHWAVAPGMAGTVGTVLYCQYFVDKEDKKGKGTWMYRHKSLGLLTGILTVPRVMVMLTSVKPVPFNKIPWERMLSSGVHYGLYGFMIIMPVTGVLMGYFSGFGLPFFVTTIPGAKEANKTIAGNAYKVHHWIGYYGKFLVPSHVGGTLYHFARGEAIFARMNPFIAAKTI